MTDQLHLFFFQKKTFIKKKKLLVFLITAQMIVIMPLLGKTQKFYISISNIFIVWYYKRNIKAGFGEFEFYFKLLQLENYPVFSTIKWKIILAALLKSWSAIKY